ncbi:MAG: formylglycine-generating enzyme family protein, partial [bacterium]
MSRSRITVGGGLAATAAVLAVAAAVALLARPLLHSWRADRVSVELGIRAAASERARAVDAAVLDSIESRSFGRELKLRLAHPTRRVKLTPFWIDRCEVRQIDFERFANWTTRQNAEASSAQQSRAAPVSTSSGHRIAGLLNSPATGVDFAGAAQYCAALGGRVPWAEELEAAAGGADGRLYAWGDAFDAAAWPYLDSWRNAARACGTHPQSDSPQGVHDLNSNAMEWSAGSIKAPPDLRETAAHGAPAVRTRARALYALNAAWLPIPANTRSHHLGFRCVYDAPPTATQRPGGDAAAAGDDAPAAIAGGEYPLGLPRDVRLARLA